VNPLKLTKLGVKSSFLEPSQFESEPGSKLLQVAPFSVLENVSMPSKKDKVSLIVESSDLTAFKLWDVRKERSKHASNGVS
jgi:hypothetical protein